jgi:DNA-binding SARP family transcriptional activator
MVLSPSCQRVVALAALKRRTLHRTWVCSTLWPDTPPRKATASLRSALWRLRPVGADPLLIIDAQSIGLAPGVSVDWHDAMDLVGRLLDDRHQACADPSLVADLLPLLRAGELLAGWSDRWFAHDRDSFHSMRLAALSVLSPSPEKQVVHYACGSVHGVPTLGSVRKTNNDPSEP